MCRIRPNVGNLPEAASPRLVTLYLASPVRFYPRVPFGLGLWFRTFGHGSWGSSVDSTRRVGRLRPNHSWTGFEGVVRLGSTLGGSEATHAHAC